MEDFFTRCDEWSTGIVSLDVQHAELANCIREIENTLPANSLSSKQQLSLLLDKLYRETKKHFKFEETSMMETGYPGLAPHKREHILLLAELSLTIKDHESGENEFDAKMVTGLKDWFISHVQLSDCKFTSYVSTHRIILE